MTHILTLVASQSPLKEKSFTDLKPILAAYNIEYTGHIIWLCPDKAAEISISASAPSALILHLREELASQRTDFFITENNTNRKKKLLLADMDSTIVEEETLDELAAYAGIKDQIAEITARAMNGELDFHAAIKERVGLLKGLKTTALSATLKETQLNPGAQVFVQTMRANGAACVLVSGGFTFFTSAIAELCGFHFNHGNTLEIEGDHLSGQVIPPILDKFAKVEFLEFYMNEYNLSAAQCLTIGDGANDLPMLKKAGLGIGYHAKESVRKELTNSILYGDLTTALYAQGYTSKEFTQV